MVYIQNEEDDSGFYDDNLAVNKPTTRWYYDGQMGMEDDYRTKPNLTLPDQYTVNRYGLGARGIDSISRYYGTPSSFSLQEMSYPVNDGHGNMVLTVRRNGSSFTTHDERRYDVWGSVRAGSGASSQRYCASLGHVSDDESGLIYMRARYYEPGSGRFVSEDPARDGINYFVYARQNPTCLVDKNGKFPSTLLGLLGGGFLTLVGVLFMGYAYEASRMSVTAVEVAEACQFAQYAVICCGMGLAVWDGPGDAFGLAEFGGGMLVGAGLEWVIRRCGVESATAAAAVGLKTKGHLAVGAAYIYCLLVTGFIVADFLGGL